MKFPELLDQGCFKAFWHAARTLNFSLAAAEASMTQSGVSQHIQKLEKNLGKPLFRRTSKVVELTAEGKRMLHFIETYLDLEATLRTDVTGTEHALRGEVHYAMPLSCLMSAHFAQLLALRQKSFPQIQLQVSIHGNETVADLISAGKVDFGFMTQKIIRSDLHYRTFCKEQYVLVGREDLIRSIDVSGKLESLPFIVYPGLETALATWANGHGRRAAKIENLSVSGQISDLRGVITMLHSGVGLTILAKHAVLSELKQGLKIAPKTKEVDNQVYVSFRKGVEQPLRVKAVIDAFFNL